MSTARQLLEARNKEFEKEIIEVADGVYTAVGYAVSIVSMIVGEDGVVIVDTGMDPPSAKQVLADFRQITDKPIKAIILTHSHPDHVGGLSVFQEAADNPQIWGRENFGDEAKQFLSVGLRYQNVRGRRQAGFLLPPDKRINNGIAQRYYPQQRPSTPSGNKSLGPKAFQFVRDEPLLTHRMTAPRQTVEIGGLSLELVATTGETYDHLYVWLPKKKVLFSGDNYYKSWPNLSPIRGAPYRDIRGWIESLTMMLSEKPSVLVAGHTRPLIGRTIVREAVTNYRDAIQFVFDKTIEGINEGLTPDELVGYVKLPEKYRMLDNIRPYYGDPEWAVRAIYAHYFGWFDGNPLHLFPLAPAEEARRMIKLVGSVEALQSKAEEALVTQDYKWAATLADYLLAVNHDGKRPKLIKAEALEAIAEDVLSGIGRNYYLTVAQELRDSAQ